MNFRILFVAIAVAMLARTPFIKAELKVGAAKVDVTPQSLPVIVNGGMTSRTIGRVNTRLFARSIVVDDGNERLAIVVVDSCMIPRPLQDDAKQLASQRTKIRPDHMLISATHTHSAPASMSCLGTDADPTYVPYLREKLAEAIAAAEAKLQPATVGWGSVDAPEYTALRRWIRRPDRIAIDPFGNPTMRAQMHSGRKWEDVVGESGPEDPELSMISFRGADGRPIALLCNFSMHYFGDRDVSADYFGLFCNALEEKIAPAAKPEDRQFVAVMSHGCSGDIWRRDYKIPAEKRNDGQKIDEYAKGLAHIAHETFQSIEYEAAETIAMQEARLHLRYRTPNQQTLEWARRVVKEMGDRLPKTQTEVYAREATILHQRQSTDVVVQGLRIGKLAIATTPNETYALTGLKIKHQSPLERTMVIELANGGDGYIPPPEQHLLGGYNTWPARSAGLEVLAEPKITEAAVGLLERVTNTPRRAYGQADGPAAKAIKSVKPVAYFRLHEWEGPHAVDASGNGNHGVLEPQTVFFLGGPASNAYSEGQLNRSAHFVDARLRTRITKPIQGDYTISMWIWNGLPTAARSMSGWFYSRGRDHSLTPDGEHLGLGGKDDSGKLVYLHRTPNAVTRIAGKTDIPRWTWRQVVLVRKGRNVRVFVDSTGKPDIEVDTSGEELASLNEWFFAGRCDRHENWEGRLDEIAIFDRALNGTEVARLFVK